MSTEIVQVNSGGVVLALGRFRLGIQQNDELMRIIGAGQLVSVRRTFREQGSPAGSWAPLSPNTVGRNPKKYGAGHKILIGSGRLINSVNFAAFTGGVVIGTNVIYARVQQEGSADRRGAAIGPQAKIAGRSVRVGRSKRLRAIQYKQVEVEGRDGTKYKVPRPVTKGEKKNLNVKGHASLNSYLQGPKNRDVEVSAHERYQNIPPRPFIVIRPEDPERIRRQVVLYIGSERRRAGLAGTGGA